ncbi:peptidoglycan DD-metalloendopeptidase family protein [Salinisphaera sp. P385]|uniref:Peptidoglycan DD-metalloendopeptidase family protein n=1 Tax=Spectribacter acetivorans TaxID=3075603 RepID=A0ABU3BBR0_9GAMM|nr:peptidoglycan DD-metalloendopeptidase family protein [Salinisphaera sp. P385]MDT0619563.1 peptidoglycan DD-metalloendopeptidase family protein [Salinisphaera sp. P385]
MPRGLAILLLTLIPAGLAIGQDLAEREQQLEALRSEIATLRNRIDQDRERRGDLSAELATVETRIAEASSELRAIREDIHAHEAEIDRLEAEAASLRDSLGGRVDTLGQRMNAAYRVGRQGRLRLILSQDDPAAIGRLLGYYEYYSQAQAGAIRELRIDLSALAEQRRQITTERQALAAAESRRASALASLDDTRRERADTLDRIKRRLADRDNNLDSLQSEAEALESLIGEVRERTARAPPPATDGKPFGNLRGQLAPPVSGRVIAGFGDAKAGGKLKWQGVWLAAGAGTSVSAAAAGRVVYVGRMHRYGLIVVLDHGDDYYTVYGHNQTAQVEVGDQVRAGQSIAAAGNSGGHDRHGVYFEIRRGRTPVDPARWLSG